MEINKSLLLFIILFSNVLYAAENCFLHNYVQHRKALIREATFTVPPAQMKVTRVLPVEIHDPYLKELVEFANNNHIVLVKDVFPPLPTEKTTYITIGETLGTEKELATKLEKLLVDHFDAPLNFDKIPPSAQTAVRKMKENFGTKFIRSQDADGLSFMQQNTIAIKLRHPENLRVSSVVNHEITHNTTDRKIFEALNPVKDAKPVPLTTILVGRHMSFRAKPAKSMKLPMAIEDYSKFYRADEIEATLREMAKAKFDKESFDTPKLELLSFINSQDQQLKSLLASGEDQLKVVTDAATPELGAGRRQTRQVTVSSVDFNVEIVVPRDLTPNQEREFIIRTFKDRLSLLDSYRQTILKKFP